MKRVVSGLSLFFLALPLLAQTSDDALVRQFFPPQLSHATYSDATRQLYTFERADLDGSGSANYLVCVYFNGFNDVLRVLRVAGAAATVAADATALPNIGGALGFVRLVDLDGDHKPEIVLTIPGERSSEDWVLAWVNGRLAVIGPTRTDTRGHLQSLLSSPELVDVDGDGIPELLVRKRTGGEPVTWVYKYANGGFARGRDVLFWQRVARATRLATQFDTEVRVDTPGDYTLTVIDGDGAGANRVTQGTIMLNGATLLDDAAFKNGERVLTVPVSLLASNDLYAEVRSATSSEFTIVITKNNEVPPCRERHLRRDNRNRVRCRNRPVDTI